jgi:hypothetical protein
LGAVNTLERTIAKARAGGSARMPVASSTVVAGDDGDSECTSS